MLLPFDKLSKFQGIPCIYPHLQVAKKILVGAYAFKGEYANGLKILENRFGQLIIQKRYIKAFEYFETKLSM